MSTREGGRQRSAPQTKSEKARASQTRPATIPRKVEAIEVGFYKHKRRRVGDVFFLDQPSDFSPRWMKPAAPGAMPRTTTGNEELRRQHDEIVAARQRDASPLPDARGGMGEDPDPIGAGE